ncbi:MAG: bifunctional adenosylcobinamide kinase/adenosylcobinamide-phosphate guanylyltransferase [Chloroflexi bacterium]|nr:bifunctional adenosylcobinamide kinase/adenosylcobinamide-phosphate guanylyltransferase [Chloroflexota bacterium]
MDMHKTQSDYTPNLTFILGGARSGKSDYALELARQLAGDQTVLFVATAQAGDAEMAERITRHRAERPEHWQTLEAPRQVGAAITTYLPQVARPPAVIVVDCLTLLVSNVLFAGEDAETEPYLQIQARMDDEVAALLVAAHVANCPVLIVSNEVGLGIVPLGRISRAYQDLIGRANRQVAAAAERAIFLLAGIPLDLKALQVSLG